MRFSAGVLFRRVPPSHRCLDRIPATGRRVEIVTTAPNDYEVYDEEYEATRPARDRRMYCFNCHRDESFFTTYRGHWLYSFLKGISLGLISFCGPFTCRCCGHRRLFWPDKLHPQRWLG